MTSSCNSCDLNVLPYPPYSPDLAPCNYHVFNSLNEPPHGHKFTSDDKVKEAAQIWILEPLKKLHLPQGNEETTGTIHGMHFSTEVIQPLCSFAHTLLKGTLPLLLYSPSYTNPEDG